MLRYEIALQKCCLNPLLLLITCVLLAKATKAQQSDSCFAVSLATVTFPKTKVKLTTSIKKKLDSAILIFNREHGCVVKVIGTSNISCAPKARDGQRTWDRVNYIATYLINNGISEHRIIFQFADIDENSVELRLDNNEILQLPLPPHPNLRQRKS